MRVFVVNSSTRKKVCLCLLVLFVSSMLASCMQTGYQQPSEEMPTNASLPSAGLTPTSTPSAEIQESEEPSPPIEQPNDSADTEVEAWEVFKDYYTFDIAVTDMDGTDISQDIIDLWVQANEVYDVDLMFDTGEYVGMDGGPLDAGYHKVLNFHEVMDGIFTETGKAQAMTAKLGEPGVLYFIEHEGDVWLKSDSGMHSRPGSIYSSEILEQSEDYIRFKMEYLTDMFVEFTVKMVDGVWLVDDYRMPTAFYP